LESAESTAPAFSVSSPALESGGELPARFTCEGAGESPPFLIEQVPEPTAALAVVATYDRGGINKPEFWTLWNVPAGTERIPAGLPRAPTVDTLGNARQGRQSGGAVGYEPPCPQVGQSQTNRFQLYALGEAIDLDGGTDHETVAEAIGNAVLASRRITVGYTRTATPRSSPR